MKKKVLRNKEISQRNICLCLGVLASLLLMLPYLILKTGSIVVYHDQLDGELLCYILGAKYLFTNVSIYPELLGGLPTTGAIPPAVLFVLLYKIFAPFTAFLISQWIVCIVGFVGMYLLADRITSRPFVALLTGFLFMLLPFYPVYGLCIPGQPLLIYCFLRLYGGETGNKPSQNTNLMYFVYILLYSLCSSLVLVGFACLLTLGCGILFLTIRNMKQKRKLPLSLWCALLLLLFGYLCSNVSLLRQILHPTPDMISHKSVIVHTSRPFIEGFKEAIYPGMDYAQSWPIAIPFLMVIAALLLIVNKFKHKTLLPGKSNKHLSLTIELFLFVLACALWYGLYGSDVIAGIRNSIGGTLASINLARITWLMPTAWMCLAALLMTWILPSPASDSSNDNTFSHVLRYSAVIGIFILWGMTIFLHSPLKSNVSKLVKGNDYYALDWEKFFAEDIFDQIDQAIAEPKDTYYVANLGIYPSAAVYNGFQCLDGYSNNYPLSYKQKFRRTFSDELEKNDYIRAYYDDWGNRCYITSAEYTTYYCIERKWNPGFHDISINTDVLKEMNCKYIFSATWISNANELGLVPLREDPFVSDNSWYNIYVYKLQ